MGFIVAIYKIKFVKNLKYKKFPIVCPHAGHANGRHGSLTWAHQHLWLGPMMSG
jgi:hypothetical protein